MGERALHSARLEPREGDSWEPEYATGAHEDRGNHSPRKPVFARHAGLRCVGASARHIRMRCYRGLPTAGGNATVGVETTCSLKPCSWHSAEQYFTLVPPTIRMCGSPRNCEPHVWQTVSDQQFSSRSVMSWTPFKRPSEDRTLVAHRCGRGARPSPRLERRYLFF